MSKYFRNGTAAIAIACISGFMAMIPDHRCWALLFAALAVLLGSAVLIAGWFSERRFRRNRDALAAYMKSGNELLYRDVKDRPTYDAWVVDFNSWYSSCYDLLARHHSLADAALFEHTEGGGFGVRGFNLEHINSKNLLLKYITNLKKITEAYLQRETN
jgi:hypothetical protein